MATINRALTASEQSVIRWILTHAPVADGASYDALTIDALRVVGGCGCGCASIDFADGTGAHVIADATALYSDAMNAGLLLWGRDGVIVGLEVYEMEPGGANRLPNTSELCTWAELDRPSERGAV